MRQSIFLHLIEIMYMMLSCDTDILLYIAISYAKLAY